MAVKQILTMFNNVKSCNMKMEIEPQTLPLLKKGLTVNPTIHHTLFVMKMFIDLQKSGFRNSKGGSTVP